MITIVFYKKVMSFQEKEDNIETANIFISKCKKASCMSLVEVFGYK